MKAFKATGIQYAALPWRVRSGRVEVLLVTSRRTRRWVIPKGWPMQGLRPHEAAAIEADEEAGVAGAISERPLGSYRYDKQLKDGRSISVQVIVFPLEVDELSTEFKESGQRNLRWFDYHEAARRVAEPSLQHLIRDFGGSVAPHPLVQSWRRYWNWRSRRLA